MSKKQAKGKSSKKKILVILGVVLLLVAALAAGLLVQRWLAGGTDSSSQQQEEEITGLPEATLPENITEIQNLRLENPEEAKKKIEEILNNQSAPSEEKYLAYLQQGNELYDKGDRQAALASYEKALAIKETYEAVRVIAETYQDLGDNTKAIEFFKKSRDLIDQNSPMRDREIELINQRIIDLGGQP